MPKILGRNARFAVDDEEIHLRSFEFEHNMETVVADASVYGDTFDQFETTRYRGRMRLNARMFDDYQTPESAHIRSGSITSSTAANDRILTAAAHGLVTGQVIRISGHSGSTPDINGDWTVEVFDTDEFTLKQGSGTLNITVGGTGGTFTTDIDHSLDQFFYNRMIDPVTGLAVTSPAVISFMQASQWLPIVSNIVDSNATTDAITTATPHGLVTGQTVAISGHSGSTPSLNGSHTVVVTGPNTFTIGINITVGGTGGTATSLGAEGKDGYFTRGFGNMSLAPDLNGFGAIRADFQETGVISFGKVLRYVELTLTNGAPNNNGPGTFVGDAANYLRTALHVVKYQVNSGGPMSSLGYFIESDNAVTFPSNATRQTIVSGAAGLGKLARWTETPGPLGGSDEDWYRLTITSGGTSPYSVTIGVICLIDTG
jgi:hypothetical protein